jgi:hypothetical protein
MGPLRKTLTKFGVRQARRHPRATLKMVSAAGRHPRRTMKAVQVVRMARQAPELAQDRAVRKRARAATSRAAKATRRARKIGWQSAATDDRVRRHLVAAARQANDAMRAAGAKSRRRGRARRMLLGASVLGAGAYAGRRRWTQSQEAATR